MYKLKSPIKPKEKTALKKLGCKFEKDEEGNTYALFATHADLQLAQSILADLRYSSKA